MTTISPCLWFDGQAEEAARFYAALLPDSRIDHVTTAPIDTPGGPAGQVLLVEFTLAGRSYQALNGGPHYRFTPAVSFSVLCEDQAEVDRLWTALTEGGREVQCGWLEDRYGLSWQIVPKALGEVMRGGDAARSGRVMAALMTMVKIDIATLRHAYDGAEPARETDGGGNPG